MEILLFVLKYMYVSLLLKMINGFSWPVKIMASPFNIEVDTVVMSAHPFFLKPNNEQNMCEKHILIDLSACFNDS